MSEVTAAVTANYASGRVLERLLALAVAEGVDPERPSHEELKRLDSFHIGGWQATEALLDPLTIAPGTRVLDIGCGIGGTARTLAARYGASVDAVDLTPEFIEVAKELTRRTGVTGVSYRVGSGTALPYEAEAFDLATLVHVGMNVPHKVGLFAEAARVLRPGGTLAVYDVMRTGPGAIGYPMPWAGTAAISFLETPDAYAALAAAAGLVERERRPRVEEGIAGLKASAATTAARGMPPERHANILAALEAGTLAPVEMIFVKPS